MLPYFALAGFICLIIGLPTFLTGCGTNIPNTCFAYYETNGWIHNFKITNHMCSECVKKENKKCVQYNYYTCYNGYVKVNYNLKENNQTCTYDAYTDEKSFTDVQNKLAYYYPIGSKKTLFITKVNMEDCTLNVHGLQGLTYVGIVFMSLAGIIFIIGFTMYLQNILSSKVVAKNVETTEV